MSSRCTLRRFASLAVPASALLACAAKPSRGARDESRVPALVGTPSVANTLPELAPLVGPSAPPSAVYAIMGGASGLICQPWDLEPDDPRETATLLDIEDAGERRFTLVQRLINEDRKPIEFHVIRRGATLTIGAPEVRWAKLGTRSALGSCKQALLVTAADSSGLTLATGGKLHFEQGECARALAHGEGPTHFGSCEPFLQTFGRGVEVTALPPDSDRLRRVIQAGQAIFWYDERARSCEAWWFLPSASHRNQGALRRQRSDGSHAPKPDLQLEFHYEFSEQSLLLTGPTTVGGSGARAGAGSLCIERLYLGPREATFVTVGGHHWFFERAACERDGSRVAEDGLRGATCGD